MKVLVISFFTHNAELGTRVFPALGNDPEPPTLSQLKAYDDACYRVIRNDLERAGVTKPIAFSHVELDVEKPPEVKEKYNASGVRVDR